MSYVILVLLAVSLVLFIWGEPSAVIFVKKHYYNFKKYQSRKKSELLENEINKHLKNAGFPFDLYSYQVARYSLTIMFFLIVTISERISYTYLLIIIAFFIITIPKRKILNIETPLMMVINKLVDRRKKIYNAEIGLFVIIMNNNFNMYKNHPPGAYKMVLEAMVGAKKTKHIFEQLLRYWQTNKIQEGIDYFVQSIGTDEAKKLGALLGKLNELHPNELKDQLVAQKEIFRKKRQVEKKNKIKSQNYVLYFIISMTVITMLLNIVMGVIDVNGGINLNF